MRNRRQRHRGQALTEFALVFPLLLLMIFVIVDFARMIYIYAVISDAAREGARYAIVHGTQSAADNPPVSGPGSGDPNGTLYVVPQAKAVAVGVDDSALAVAACWGFNCQVATDCSSGTSNAGSPIANVPVTVRSCYGFRPITATPIRFLFSLLRINWNQGVITLGAEATLPITH